MRPAPQGPGRGDSASRGSRVGDGSTAQQRKPGLPAPRRPSSGASTAAAPAAAAGDPVCLPLRAVRNPAALRHGPTEVTVIPNGHDRSILCIDVHPSCNFCATGSADGGLRLFALPSGEGKGGLVCELYGVTWGHSDWVTSCAFAEDGRLLSGAMDGKICLWPQTLANKQTPRRPSASWAPQSHDSTLLSLQQQQHQQQQMLVAAPAKPPDRTVMCKASTNRVRCKELGNGHRGGVSQVAVRGGLGASCGYDGCLRLWSLDKAKETAEIPAVDMGSPGALGSLAPLLQFVWLNAFAAAGSKKGAITLWDLNKETIAARIPAAHRGAVGDLQLLLPPEEGPAAPTSSGSSSSSSSSSSSGFVPLLVSSGRADGRLCVFDLRCLPSPVCTTQAHSAAVNAVLPLRMGGGPLSCPSVCTLGADGSCKAWDLRGLSAEAKGQPSCQPLASVSAGRGGFLCGTLLDDREGLVCAGAADGAAYLLDLSAAACTEPTDRPAACWGYGCDSRGAVQTLKSVLLSPLGGTAATSVAVLAGGDDGHLACLKLG